MSAFSKESPQNVVGCSRLVVRWDEVLALEGVDLAPQLRNERVLTVETRTQFPVILDQTAILTAEEPVDASLVKQELENGPE